MCLSGTGSPISNGGVSFTESQDSENPVFRQGCTRVHSRGRLEAFRAPKNARVLASRGPIERLRIESRGL